MTREQAVQRLYERSNRTLIDDDKFFLRQVATMLEEDGRFINWCAREAGVLADRGKD